MDDAEFVKESACHYRSRHRGASSVGISGQDGIRAKSAWNCIRR